MENSLHLLRFASSRKSMLNERKFLTRTNIIKANAVLDIFNHLSLAYFKELLIGSFIHDMNYRAQAISNESLFFFVSNNLI